MVLQFDERHFKLQNLLKEARCVMVSGRVSYEIVNVPDSLTADGEVVRRTVKQLKQFAKSDKPFFMAAGCYKPHLPFVAPQKYDEVKKTYNERV
mgnify:CR=1 FL=1